VKAKAPWVEIQWELQSQEGGHRCKPWLFLKSLIAVVPEPDLMECGEQISQPFSTVTGRKRQRKRPPEVSF
jgi:hypothetical protein